MSEAQKTIGACLRRLREQKQLSLESLAAKADISYQYLSGVETGKENFSIQVLEALSKALQLPLKVIVASAYAPPSRASPPLLKTGSFRPQVPLPLGLTLPHIEAAANLTQSIIHRINRNLSEETGSTLQSLIQGNNFSGLVSNILTNAFDQCSPYKHNHAQRYPDLVFAGGKGRQTGLEIKTTINVGKGGESHNGHHGWHLVACYGFLPDGDIRFTHIMLAVLNGHLDPLPDWGYLGSRVNAETGSRRTETYTTNLIGTTKLRDGSVYLDAEAIDFSRWRQPPSRTVPAWSIFAATTAPAGSARRKGKAKASRE